MSSCAEPTAEAPGQFSDFEDYVGQYIKDKSIFLSVYNDGKRKGAKRVVSLLLQSARDRDNLLALAVDHDARVADVEKSSLAFDKPSRDSMIAVFELAEKAESAASEGMTRD